MQQLSETTATQATSFGAVKQASYDRDTVCPGVVHFGVGNFHRCHQAVYFDDLLDQGDLNWGIVGVSMRSAKIRDLLAPQDFLYTQATLSDETEFRIIGAIQNIIVAPEDPTAVIQQVANDNIHLVTTTITEKGYYLTSGGIDFQHEDILNDVSSLQTPKTIYGYLAAAIIERRENNRSPFSILCCDNIQNGGKSLQLGVLSLLKQHCEASADWALRYVSFGASMVDRVSPATDQRLKNLVNSKLNLLDAWPVSAEPFRQWIIEDNFLGARPALEKVGVIFTDDIYLYEQMKLRFLNAGHSMISVLAYLDSYQSVHQALEHAYIEEFVLKALHENILPTVKMPDGIKAKNYITDVMQRFKNSALPYAAQQVNTDISQKIQQRWFPSIDAALVGKTPFTKMSFILAMWVIYIQKALDSKELNDPKQEEFLSLYHSNVNIDDRQIVSQFLAIAGANRFKFFESTEFMGSVYKHYQEFKGSEIKTAIKDFLVEKLSSNLPKAEINNHA